MPLTRFVPAAAASGYGFRAVSIALSDTRMLTYDDAVRVNRQHWPAAKIAALSPTISVPKTKPRKDHP